MGKITMESIYKTLNDLHAKHLELGMIVINEVDFNELKSKVKTASEVKFNTMLGLKLIVIPPHLMNQRLLEVGTSIIFEKKYLDFLKEIFK